MKGTLQVSFAYHTASVVFRMTWCVSLVTTFLDFTERRREKAAMEFAREMLAVKDEEVKDKVVSSWGP